MQSYESLSLPYTEYSPFEDLHEFFSSKPEFYSFDNTCEPSALFSPLQTSGTSEVDIGIDPLFLANPQYISDDNQDERRPLHRQRSWDSFKKAIMPMTALRLGYGDDTSDEPQTPERTLQYLHPSPASSTRRVLGSVSPLVSTPGLSFSSSDLDDDENSGDDEYRPSPEPESRKRQRSPSIVSRSSTSSSPRPKKKPCRSFSEETDEKNPSASRNLQAKDDVADKIKRMLRSNDLLDRANFHCPFPNCNSKDRRFNRRVPDFRRHLETHLRTDRVRCRGVPLQQASRYRIPSSAVPYTLTDRPGEWIGGCQRSFSRADALKRHLDNAKTYCVGDPSRC